MITRQQSNLTIPKLNSPKKKYTNKSKCTEALYFYHSKNVFIPPNVSNSPKCVFFYPNEFSKTYIKIILIIMLFDVLIQIMRILIQNFASNSATNYIGLSSKIKLFKTNQFCAHSCFTLKPYKCTGLSIIFTFTHEQKIKKIDSQVQTIKQITNKTKIYIMLGRQIHRLTS